MNAWPLMGRATELDRIERALVHDRRGIVLAAPAGLGKTTLLAALAGRAEHHGMCVVRATATHASSSLPFGALAPILPAHAAPEDVWTVDAGTVLRRYADGLVAHAGGRPMLLVVDDAHLLDQPSATLVHQLASGGRAVVLTAVRVGEGAPDPIVALWKDGVAERVDLGALSVDDVAAILESVLGGPVDRGTATEFARRCDGNPLFLRELVLTAIETGALSFDAGIWRRAGVLRPSSRLIELVQHRLDALTSAEHTLLERIALAEPLGRTELEHLGDAVTIASLERPELVAVEMNGRRLEVRPAHPVYGEVVMARVNALREQELAQRQAEVLESTGMRRREDVLRVAVWRLVAGGGSADLLLDAAHRARNRLDHALAERLARAAADAGAGFEARFIAAESAFLLGRSDDAEHQLAALALEATTDAQRARIAATRFDNAWFVRRELATEILDEVEATLTDPYWRAELLARRLSGLYVVEGPQAVVDAARPVLEQSSGVVPPWAALVAAFGLVRVGRLDQALVFASRVDVDLGTRTAGPWFGPTHLRIRGMALTYGGRLSQAADLLEPAYGQAVEERALEPQAFLAAALALLHLHQGRVRLAEQRAREALRIFIDLGRALLTQDLYVVSAMALASAGDADGATEMLAALDAADLPLRANDPDLLQARAWTAAAGGDVPAAYALLARAQDSAFATGDLVGAASTMYTFARLGQAKRVHESLAAIAPDIDGELVRAQAAHAEALTARNAEALERSSRTFEAMGALLYAAEASADAAVMHRRAGQPRLAVATEQRAALLTRECEGARTPSLQAVGPRAVLSPAELSTARLAAAGRSNKEIAAELYLSVRTVENRLQRIYDKVGVSGRAELRTLLEMS